MSGEGDSMAADQDFQPKSRSRQDDHALPSLRLDNCEYYQDEDGAATEESTKAFSDTRPRAAVALSSAIGLVVSVLLTTLLSENTDLISLWSGPLSWGIICLQCSFIPTRHQYFTKFTLIIFGLASSGVLVLSFAFRHGSEAITSLIEILAGHRIDAKAATGLLYLIQLISALVVFLAYAGFPRRPDVYHRGHLVDQQHTVSLLALFSFYWNRVVFSAARKRRIEIGDLPTLDYETRSESLKRRFLLERSKGKGGPLMWQLFRFHTGELVLQGFFALAIAVVSLSPQFVVLHFLRTIENRPDDTNSADPALAVWVLGLLLGQVAHVWLVSRLKWAATSRLEIPVGSLLQSLVFSKVLMQYEIATTHAPTSSNDDNTVPVNDERKINKEQKQRRSVINHMKLDSSRITTLFLNSSNYPLVVSKLLFAGFFLVGLMGWLPVLSGLTVAMTIAFLSVRISARFRFLQTNLMRSRDEKAHLFSESLQGMAQIKLSALEGYCEDRILASRNAELGHYWVTALWQNVLNLVMSMGPLFLGLIILSTYVWQNSTHIQASVIFTALGLFDQLDETVADLPGLQMNLAEAFTSAARLDEYLDRQSDRDPVLFFGDTITFENATVAWPRVEDSDDLSTDNPSTGRRETRSILTDLNLAFPKGELSVIVGKTGSGKSLLLASILGEVKLLAGNIRVPAPPPMDMIPEFIPESEWVVPQLTSFVSQTPRIESGTVRENILFGLPFSRARYKETIRACALEKDMELLTLGDHTEVGPKGVTLSGGQRWRVALARALYSRAGIMVLDDVLSAVDAQVGRWLVNEALTGKIAHGRTRILATHHVELVLPYASYVVALGDRRQRSAEDVVMSLTSYGGTADQVPTATALAPTPRGEITLPSSPISETPVRAEEAREIGGIKWRVFIAYFHAGGGWPRWLSGILVIILGHLFTVLRTWSLQRLSDKARSDAPPSQSIPIQVPFGARVYEILFAVLGNKFWMFAYFVFCIMIIVTGVARAVIFVCIGMKASKALFQQMTHPVLRAPMRWIDTVPTGRIANRFTTDTNMVDDRLCRQIVNLLHHFSFLVLIICTSLYRSSMVVFGCLFLVGAVLFIVYASIAFRFISVAREVKRLNSVSHSPIYDQFTSVLSGLSTIRAFDRTRFYMDRMHHLIDNSAKSTWALELSNRWMIFRIGVLGALFVTVVAGGIAFSGLDAAAAGFRLSFALRYSNALKRVLQSTTSVELAFNACERILEYAEMPCESEGGNDAPAAWPSEGKIEVDSLTAGYAPSLPPVLKNLNFTICPGERVGIVGRTGAGKTSLAAVLFRLLDPSHGCVRIDNVDISTLKLTQLRSRLAIIPQNPFLFSGTLRSNLDVEGRLDDHELQTALQRAHLVEPAEGPDTRTRNPTVTSRRQTNIFTNLSTPIGTGGTNLSHGQRQLVCLARALLARPKIVVLDEATSAVDQATDKAIQASLRREFTASGCAVLVIAHRLSTVADFDRLLVLEKGRVAELGSPRALLEAGMAKEKRARASSQDGETMDGRYAAEEEEDDDVDDSGTGAFWALVRESAEKDRLIEMILGDGENAE
ncbi:hypothetical protein B0T19DRAFT_455213 [Cercophora scortea]|uniref:Uncharacterized protein n=1 Tax=Cercophora scortea TaxID=314031 RepID=A0AAE0J5R5_9PEZI|nr:hypothetical protein B0T19DRAFT_455213 [Cercophora scortea]